MQHIDNIKLHKKNILRKQDKKLKDLDVPGAMALRSCVFLKGEIKNVVHLHSHQFYLL